MDWWVGSLLEFVPKLPEDERSFVLRLLESGSKGIDLFARTGLSLYGNFVLLHRDAIVKEFQSTVPQDQVALLRNAVLPMSDSLFPSDLVALVVEKRRTAVQDAVLQQALVPKRIPRVSSKGRESVGQQPGTSGASTGAAGSPVVPRGGAPGSSAAPSSSSRSKRKKQKKSGPFSGGSSLPVQGGAKGKGRGKN